MQKADCGTAPVVLGGTLNNQLICETCRTPNTTALSPESRCGGRRQCAPISPVWPQSKLARLLKNKTLARRLIPNAADERLATPNRRRT